MSNRTSTKSCFIWKDSPGYTFFHTHEERSYCTAGHRCGWKGTFKNRSEYCRDISVIQDHNSDCKNNINDRHKRNQLFRYLPDSFDSSKKDQPDQYCQNNSDHQIQSTHILFTDHTIIIQSWINCCRDGIDLCCIPRSEYRQYTKCREQIGQPVPLLLQSIFYVVHRSSDQITFRVFLPEMYRKRYFWKLCTHSKKCWYPHPEDCTRASDRDCSCHACNITGSDGRSQCRTYCLEWCQCSVWSFSFFQHPADCYFHRIWEFTDLKKSGSDA